MDANVKAEHTRLVVVDDHPVVCRGVELLIEEAPDVTVVGHATSLAEGLNVIELARPDVALVDLRLGDGMGVDLARIAHNRSTATQVIIFTAHSDHEAMSGKLPPNVRGCILKDTDAIDLVAFIRNAARGQDVRDERITATRSDRTRQLDKLTAREHDVLRAVAAGDTNSEIAAALGLAQNTVKAYLRTVLQKLGARNRLEAVMRAQSRGLL